MKKGFLLFLALFVVVFMSGIASASVGPVSLSAHNFSRGESNRQWDVKFDITVTNNSDEGLVTRIYDLSCEIEARATDMSASYGGTEWLSCTASVSAPKAFAKLNLAPGKSVTGSVSIPYVNFHGRWKWEGEEKNKKFHLTDFRVSGIQAKADPGGSVVGWKTTDFLELCWSGTTQEVEAAIKSGADVNPKLGDELDAPFPPLVAAVYNPDLDVIKVLLKNGADINSSNNYGYTALIKAVDSDKTEAVRLLLENGGDAGGYSDWGLTVLMYAMDSSPNLEIVALLLDNGADPNAPFVQLNNPSHGSTVLMRAAKNLNSEAISLLLDKGADAKMTDNAGKTALDYAAEAAEKEQNEQFKDTDVYRRLEELTRGTKDEAD